MHEMVGKQKKSRAMTSNLAATSGVLDRSVKGGGERRGVGLREGGGNRPSMLAHVVRTSPCLPREVPTKLRYEGFPWDSGSESWTQASSFALK